MEKVKIAKVLKRIGTSIEKDMNKLLKDKDISASQGMMICVLAEKKNGTLPIKALEKHMAVSQPTALGVINRMEAKGLVSTFVTEQRTKMVSLTDAGFELRDHVVGCIQKAEEGIFANFTTVEKMMFEELLRKIDANVCQYHAIDEVSENE